jgi:predicted AAA+ superfamily ATPase
MNGAEEPRVAIHDALRREAASAMVGVGEIEEEAARAFTLEECWVRGRFEARLSAPTEDRSFAWRADFIRDGLPLLPRDRRDRLIDPADFWMAVARMNGTPQAALQKRVGRDAATVEQILRMAEQQNILFRLPHWTGPGQAPNLSDLVYWTDSGLLHRLLNARVPGELPDPARGKSYEGFAINALSAAGGVGVRPRVWRRGEDEIDLILEWPGGGERWAIEVTYAETKAPGAGFDRGCEVTQPTRKIIVQRREESDHVRDVERMSLTTALREVLAL